MSNHGKNPKKSNLTSKITWPTLGGGKGKNKKKKSKGKLGSALSTTSTNLPTFTVTVPKTVVPQQNQIEEKVRRGIIKDLTRVTVDRDGKRSMFSTGTGKIADKMHENTPESAKTNTSGSVQAVLKNWNMFKSPKQDEIT